MNINNEKFTLYKFIYELNHLHKQQFMRIKKANSLSLLTNICFSRSDMYGLIVYHL